MGTKQDLPLIFFMRGNDFSSKFSIYYNLTKTIMRIMIIIFLLFSSLHSTLLYGSSQPFPFSFSQFPYFRLFIFIPSLSFLFLFVFSLSFSLSLFSSLLFCSPSYTSLFMPCHIISIHLFVPTASARFSLENLRGLPLSR